MLRITSFECILSGSLAIPFDIICDECYARKKTILSFDSVECFPTLDAAVLTLGLKMTFDLYRLTLSATSSALESHSLLISLDRGQITSKQITRSPKNRFPITTRSRNVLLNRSAGSEIGLGGHSKVWTGEEARHRTDQQLVTPWRPSICLGSSSCSSSESVFTPLALIELVDLSPGWFQARIGHESPRRIEGPNLRS